MNQTQQKKLEQLTPEQESLIPIINDKWINLALDGKTELEYSKELQFGINWFYEKANQKNTNPLIIIAPSPYAAQLIANVLNNTSLSEVQNHKPGKVINDFIGTTSYVPITSGIHGMATDAFRNVANQMSVESSSVPGAPIKEHDLYVPSTFNIALSSSKPLLNINKQVAINIRKDITNKIKVDTRHTSIDVALAIYKKVHADISSLDNLFYELIKVGNLIRTNIFKNLASKVRACVLDYVRCTIARQVLVSINDVIIPIETSVLSRVWCDIVDSKLTKFEHFNECHCLNDLCGRLSYLDYFDAIGVLKNEEFRKLRDVLSLGIWTAIFFENVAILSMTPSKVLLDDNKRLHSVSEPAIQFRDGYSIYRIHGIEFDEKTFYDLTQRKIPVKDILQLENIEQRYVALEYYGFDTILDELNARLIDESPRGNKLYEIDFAGSAGNVVTTKFLKYSCPSTERNYGSFVKPEITQADQAMAWKHNCTEEEYEVLRIEA